MGFDTGAKILSPSPCKAIAASGCLLFLKEARRNDASYHDRHRKKEKRVYHKCRDVLKAQQIPERVYVGIEESECYRTGEARDEMQQEDSPES